MSSERPYLVQQFHHPALLLLISQHTLANKIYLGIGYLRRRYGIGRRYIFGPDDAPYHNNLFIVIYYPLLSRLKRQVPIGEHLNYLSRNCISKSCCTCRISLACKSSSSTRLNACLQVLG